MDRRDFLLNCIRGTAKIALLLIPFAILEYLTSYNRIRKAALKSGKPNPYKNTEQGLKLDYWNDSTYSIKIYTQNDNQRDKIFSALRRLKEDPHFCYEKFLDKVNEIRVSAHPYKEKAATMWVSAYLNDTIYVDPTFFNESDEVFSCGLLHEYKHLEGYGEVIAHLDSIMCTIRNLF